MRPWIDPATGQVPPAFWDAYNAIWGNLPPKSPPSPGWGVGTPGGAGTKTPPPGGLNSLPLALLAAQAAAMWAPSYMPAPGTLGGLNVGGAPGPRPAGGPTLPPGRPGGGRPVDPRVAAWLAGGGIR